MSPYVEEERPGRGGTSQEQAWAMGCHLAAFGKYCPVPFGGILGPLIVWQMKKNEFPLVDDQGKEALNFQIAVSLAHIAALGILFVGFLMPPLLLLGGLLLGVIAIADLVLTIIAALEANKGHSYRYPFSLRLVK